MSSTLAVETEETEEGAASPPEELDQIFVILQNHRRRLVLEYLRDRDSTTQGDLARHVAAVENDVPEDTVTSTQRKRVYVSLYQAHLPKLDQFDAIAFDQDRGTIERTPKTDELLAYLDRFEGRADSTREKRPLDVLLLLSALGVVFAGELGVFPDGLSLGLALVLSLGGIGAVVYDR
ncbi:DUF7344 domain-containing protein [Haloplanus aerogenes]|uniref:DUF7344 domain-containing protein n=1 Tax=Haloplanus aerogenes TaxID=660522 RepID=A0A3M0CTJ8_9EURY|nr:hypothetical protein [Haloplanus aerogenes]AZH26562.1 hypothetical protein DU502_14800 [Haloplanus aerogenes]RMB12792.1 hypothetical protein ATH50_2946 [Haloplanus aerogenes]